MSEESSDSDIVDAVLVCPVCEADLKPGLETCLRCAFEPKTNPFASPGPNASPIEQSTRAQLSVVGVMMTFGLIGVLVAMFFVAPGMAVLLSLLTLPPWIRTTLVIFKRSGSGLETDRAAKISLFFGSALITWLILTVSLISCCLTFCAACWAVLIFNQPSNTYGFEDSIGWILFGVVAATFVLIMAAFSPWIRHRWIRDTTKER